MAIIGNFDDSGTLQIEVDGVSTASAYASEFARALQTLNETMTSLLNEIPTEQRPQQLSLVCGLKALPEGGFAVSYGATTANFSLSLTWRSEEQGGLLGGSVLQQETGLGL
jgi:hypothetical protein